MYDSKKDGTDNAETHYVQISFAVTWSVSLDWRMKRREEGKRDGQSRYSHLLAATSKLERCIPVDVVLPRNPASVDDNNISVQG